MIIYTVTVAVQFIIHARRQHALIKQIEIIAGCAMSSIAVTTGK